MSITCCGKPEETKQQLTLNNVLKGDPTRTLTTRKRFIADMMKRFKRLRREIGEAIILNDVFGLREESLLILQDMQFLQSRPGQFDFPRDDDKLRAFNDWLQQQINLGILEISTIGGAVPIGIFDNWTDKYIQSAYQRGIARGRQELIKAGANVPTLAETGGIQAAFNQPFHTNRVALIFTRTFEELENVTRVMSNDISRTLAQALAEGLSPRQIVFGTDTLKGLNNDIEKAMIRARAIARTEVIRAHHAANIQEYKAAGIEGVEVIAEWSTAGFGVCFSPWAYVQTGTGVKPIQEIYPGDYVQTRQGLKMVLLNSKRLYNGVMIKLKTDIGTTYVTDEHPYWDINKGWVEAKDLTINNTLQSVSNKVVNILRVDNINIGYSTDRKPFIDKKGIFSRIFNWIVPIYTINFKRYIINRKKEINKIGFSFESFNRVFLNIFNLKRIKSFSGSCFGDGFTSKLPVTSETTKNIIIRRNCSELFTTVLAKSYQRGPSAFFRAIMSVKPSCNIGLFVFKRFLASFTGNKNKAKVFTRAAFSFTIVAILASTAFFYFK